MTSLSIAARAAPISWLGEARATLALGAPLALTNLAQMAITTTDVVMLGWLGAHELAAGTLGSTLFHALALPAFGVAIAVSPLIAQARGRNRHSVRDVRRSVRQGAWASVTVTIPIWLLLWNAEPVLLLLGQAADLSRDAALYLRFQMWSALPFLLFMVLRNFVAALERPRSALMRPRWRSSPTPCSATD
jgi:MATE family multidrug resistance protein